MKFFWQKSPVKKRTRKPRAKTDSKIKLAFEEIKQDLDEMRSELQLHKNLINRNSEIIISKAEIEDLIKVSLQSETYFGLRHESTPKAEPFIQQIVKRAIKTRPDFIKTAISTLLNESRTTTQIYNKVVLEKQLCGKTQFYHYLSIVRAELRSQIRAEVRNENNRTEQINKL